MQCTWMFAAKKPKNLSKEVSRLKNLSSEKGTFLKTVSLRLILFRCCIFYARVLVFYVPIYLLIIYLGNFGFGIDEHIDLGIKYDTSTGIFGMDFYVVLGRKGHRVSQRRNRRARVGKFQRVSKDDAKLWFIETMGGTILN